MHEAQDFEAVWQGIEAELEPRWDMTERVFKLTHPAYPGLSVEAPSYDAALRAYYLALEKRLE